MPSSNAPMGRLDETEKERYLRLQKNAQADARRESVALPHHHYGSANFLGRDECDDNEVYMAAWMEEFVRLNTARPTPKTWLSKMIVDEVCAGKNPELTALKIQERIMAFLSGDAVDKLFTEDGR